MLHTNLNKQQRFQKTLEIFQDVNLTNPKVVFNKYPHQLSGGMQQRIIIAIALATQPSLLLADEPTTALDITTQQNLISLLNKLKAKYNMSIIFITHNLLLAQQISDHTLVMYQGEIIESNPNILINPQHNYTKQLINNTTLLQKTSNQQNNSPLLIIKNATVKLKKTTILDNIT